MNPSRQQNSPATAFQPGPAAVSSPRSPMLSRSGSKPAGSVCRSDFPSRAGHDLPPPIRLPLQWCKRFPTCLSPARHPFLTRLPSQARRDSSHLGRPPPLPNGRKEGKGYSLSQDSKLSPSASAMLPAGSETPPPAPSDQVTPRLRRAD